MSVTVSSTAEQEAVQFSVHRLKELWVAMRAQTHKNKLNHNSIHRDMGLTDRFRTHTYELLCDL